ncbi:ATP-binding protein [Pleionea sp. CnH1-48]|uniref:ATP-binding protein n=1 Tax=Pleionea sp. CnH1-48 TaxID=2954494 RepID=UPI002096D7EA|nr:ATP-binding protein [Pleionea sp. CnH1-48]MCO7226087.1 ATP-binding protein [Pleionea sp. CnH1-48]
MDYSELSFEELLTKVLAIHEPEESLDTLAQDICRKLGLSDLAVYMATVIEGTESLMELYCSNNRCEGICVPESKAVAKQPFPPCWNKQYRPIFKDKGICEWVLRNNQWLMGDDFSDKSGCFEFLSQQGDKIRIKASKATDWKCRSNGDTEKSAFFLPFYIKDKSASAAGEHLPNAVLALRRDESESFKQEDIEDCQHYQSAISACCHHMIAVYDKQFEYELHRHLMDEVNVTASHAFAHQHILQSSCVLQKACIALSFDRAVYQSVEQQVWFCSNSYINAEDFESRKEEGESLEYFQAMLSDIRMMVEHTGAVSSNELEQALQSVLAGQRLTQDIVIQNVVLLQSAEDATKALILLRWPIDANINFLNASGDEKQLQRFIDSIDKHTELYYRAYTRDRISRLHEKMPNGNREPLLHQIMKTTGADRVFLYLGDESNTYLHSLIEKRGESHVYRDNGELNQFDPADDDVECNHTRTLRSSLLIPDVNDARLAINQAVSLDYINDFIKPRTVSDILSWMIVPIAKGERCYGFLALMTLRVGGQGKVLNNAAENFCKAFADYLFFQQTKILRVESLRELNELTSDLSSYTGKRLENTIKEKLTSWTGKFVSKDSRIAIFTYDETGKLVCCNSDGISQKTLDFIERRNWKEENDSRHYHGWHYYGAPIAMGGSRSFYGSFVVLNKSPFSKHQQAIIQDAVFDLSMLILQEYLRHQRHKDLAKYRHAIMAPAQGLVSKAESAMYACKKFLDEKDYKARQKELRWDSEIIRQWVNRSRLLGEQKELRIQPNRHGLIPLLENCMSRFQVFAEERNIHLEFKPHYTGALEFLFDKPAIDVAISNILDNAIKYGFKNTTISVFCFVDGAHVKVNVVDIGHPLPPDFDEQYEIGSHFTWEDPFRVIAGEGYGVAIIKSIVAAHQGHISFESEPVTTGSTNSKKNRHKVTVTMKLPHHWHRRR